MNTCPAHDDDGERVRLQADFPAYRIWRAIRRDGVPGDWMATLRDPSAGVDPTVMASSADELREALIAERARVAAERRARMW